MIATAVIILKSVITFAVGLFSQQVAYANRTTGTSPTQAWTVGLVTYLSRQQLPDGAILLHSNEIEPYFANFAAIGLADVNTAESDSVVLQWMKWYVSHLNTGSGNGLDGLPGTIYDYRYNRTRGTETSTKTMDSVDGYAATFLSLAYAAYETKDSSLQAFVSNHLTNLEQIAGVLTKKVGSGGVRLSNNLDVAMPTHRIAYTMDNAEVYRGLTDFANLEEALGRTRQSTVYGSAASATQTAILNHMWNSTLRQWDWYAGVSASPTRFYPFAPIQLWPIINGVVAPSSTYAKDAWTAFITQSPKWMDDQIDDGYPDTYMAFAAELMGDSADATTLLTHIYNTYTPNWAWPWFPDEAGWFLRSSGANPIG